MSVASIEVSHVRGAERGDSVGDALESGVGVALSAPGQPCS